MSDLKRRRGRPTVSNPKSERIALRLTPQEVEHLMNEAKKEGKVLSQYVRSQVFKDSSLA